MYLDFYDVHIHLLFECPRNDIKRKLVYLEEIELSGFDALVIAEYPDDIVIIQKMIPKDYHKQVNHHVLEKQRDPFPLIKGSSHMRIVPCLDARFIENDIEQKIDMYRGVVLKVSIFFMFPRRMIC